MLIQWCALLAIVTYNKVYTTCSVNTVKCYINRFEDFVDVLLSNINK